MQVICTDGTVLECERFKAIDSGVLLFGERGRRTTQQPEGEAADEEDTEESEQADEAFGFVPLHSVRYVLPEGAMGPQATRQPAPQPTSGAQQSPPGAQPGAGAPPQSTGAPPSGTGQPPSQGGPGRQY